MYNPSIINILHFIKFIKTQKPCAFWSLSNNGNFIYKKYKHILMTLVQGSA